MSTLKEELEAIHKARRNVDTVVAYLCEHCYLLSVEQIDILELHLIAARNTIQKYDTEGIIRTD